MDIRLFFYDVEDPAPDFVSELRSTPADKVYLISQDGSVAPRWGNLKILDPASLAEHAICDPGSRRTFILDCDDAQRLSRLLIKFRALRRIDIFAPKTAHHYSKRPAFLNSAPKCGTHLLTACLEAMGFAPPPADATPDMTGRFDNATYYNLQHMRVEDMAGQYRKIGPFIDAFARSVLLFIERDPRDAIISWANYIPRQREYHILSHLMESMTQEERIDSVIRGDHAIPVVTHRFGDHDIEALAKSWNPKSADVGELSELWLAATLGRDSLIAQHIDAITQYNARAVEKNTAVERALQALATK